jgi:hypothetical protein
VHVKVPVLIADQKRILDRSKSPRHVLNLANPANLANLASYCRLS